KSDVISQNRAVSGMLRVVGRHAVVNITGDTQEAEKNMALWPVSNTVEIQISCPSQEGTRDVAVRYFASKDLDASNDIRRIRFTIAARATALFISTLPSSVPRSTLGAGKPSNPRRLQRVNTEPSPSRLRVNGESANVSNGPKDDGEKVGWTGLPSVMASSGGIARKSKRDIKLHSADTGVLTRSLNRPVSTLDPTQLGGRRLTRSATSSLPPRPSTPISGDSSLSPLNASGHGNPVFVMDYPSLMLANSQSKVVGWDSADSELRSIVWSLGATEIFGSGFWRYATYLVRVGGDGESGSRLRYSDFVSFRNYLVAHLKKIKRVDREYGEHNGAQMEFSHNQWSRSGLNMDEATTPQISGSRRTERPTGSYLQNVSKKARRETDCDGNPFWPADSRDPEYYFEGGLRKVRPYFWTYNAHAKQRWLGRTLLDVFVSEFKDATEEYYRKAIESRLIVVSGRPISADYVIRDGDKISHSIHRHEPPVGCQEIEVVDKDSTPGVVVISKPAGLTVHPSGRYHHNTLLYILRREYSDLFGNGTPQLVNRLDRLTSGLMLIASTTERSREMDRALRGRSVKKEYICRVLGVFPENPVTVNQPMVTVSHKLALNSVVEDPSDPNAKPAITEFVRLSTNGFTSVVKARPRTGRTHQIRVHLQWLGFPIANDPLYCNNFWDNILSTNSSQGTDSSIADRSRMTGVPELNAAPDAHVSPRPTSATAETVAKAMLTHSRAYEDARRAEMERRFHAAFNVPPESETDPAVTPVISPLKRIPCLDCASPLPDPQPELLCIWLHAYAYENVPGEVLIEADEKDEVPVVNGAHQTQVKPSETPFNVSPNSRCVDSDSPSVAVAEFKLDTHPWRFQTDIPVWAREDFDGDRRIVSILARRYESRRSVGSGTAVSVEVDFAFD
ncbi:hypothetical protein HDU93_008975, partial [Gonapodya sp. JEL0774]